MVVVRRLEGITRCLNLHITGGFRKGPGWTAIVEGLGFRVEGLGSGWTAIVEGLGFRV